MPGTLTPSSQPRCDLQFVSVTVYHSQVLSEGGNSGHMSGVPSILGPQIVFDLTPDIYGISGFVVAMLLKELNNTQVCLYVI